ncbi:MAG TPA: polyprenyl synthetase family protein [Anaerolineaceae bacterium]|jgi:geranylgeranyl pyrophosphate synthase|nr:polyprenyl synthetase family protein [Anaerolineaceae bacterium]HOD03537.1 polyprenyl synthetase family protein [Anaerolineaceae bacterium]
MQTGCLDGELLLRKSAQFLSLVQEDLAEVEALLRTQAHGYHPDLQAAFNHLLQSGGKRVRPAVTMLIGHMLGAPHDQCITLAASIEMLHTATLVHDDLIDGSLLRRGSPTLNAQWSPGATVLTGDFLFSIAARLAAETDSIEVMKVFARTLTIIVNGEISQLFTSRCQASRENYYQRIYAKTGSLFETSAYAAALISPVDGKISEAMKQYGYEIGIAFQLVDDVLDFTADEATLGKPVGSDLRQGLVTLPAILYAESNPQDPAAADILNGRCVQEEAEINRLVEAICKSDAITRAMAEASNYVSRAMECLQTAPNSASKAALEDLAQYIVARNL